MEKFDLYDGEIGLQLIRRSKGQASSGHVPVYYFSIYRLVDKVELGQCDLRVGNNATIEHAGHIGYGVKAVFRGHHYAAKACQLLAQLAKEKGLKTLIITCAPDNIASQKTCQWLGAQFMGIVDVPVNSLDFALGDKQKCIYHLKID